MSRVVSTSFHEIITSALLNVCYDKNSNSKETLNKGCVLERVGLYAWGGPGTIRLLNVKYHNPTIDEASFLHLYDPPFLAQASEKLGVTDMWVTYSWGFADATEQVDREFIAARLPNFKQHGIRTHAYIQGLNLVTGEFGDHDVFCRDSKGRLLPYSKGRSLTCPNKPQARAIIRARVKEAARADFDGIFVDNIIFGLPPFFFRRDYTSFWGCACTDCQQMFEAQFGYQLPLNGLRGDQQIRDYLQFRCRSVAHLLGELSVAARDAGKQFGINLYDPFCHTPEVYFGYCLSEIAPLLDYYLIENLALGRGCGIDNTHLNPLIENDPKPVFVVSYRDGIGADPAYTQADIDHIWSEAHALGYAPCLKATEYITGRQWHALRIEDVQPPQIIEAEPANTCPIPLLPKKSRLIERAIIRLVSRYYAFAARTGFENRYLASVLMRMGFYVWLMKTCRTFTFGSAEMGAIGSK